MKTHVFEQAGLGKAPFQVVDVYREPDPDMHIGFCNYCGHEIVVICCIKSSDGKFFKVGSSCVKKTCDGMMIKSLSDLLANHKYRERKAAERKQWELDHPNWKAEQEAQMAEEQARAEIEAQLKAKSQFVGQVGERISITATVEKIIHGEGNFGPWTLTGVRDDSGNAYSYFNSISLNEIDENGFNKRVCVTDKITFKATVKDHSEYRGEKQTKLSRAGKATKIEE